MQDVMLTYFSGEKHAGLLLAGIGVMSIAVAAVFFQSRWEMRSFAVTLAVVALAEIAIGAGLYLRTDPQVGELLALLNSDASRFFTEEGARIARVQSNFPLIQYVEMAVVLIAAVVAVVAKDRFSVAGIALALLIHASVLLAFDIVAERRGAVYAAAISGKGDRERGIR